jgi:hypothetical protein
LAHGAGGGGQQPADECHPIHLGCALVDGVELLVQLAMQVFEH